MTDSRSIACAVLAVFAAFLIALTVAPLVVHAGTNEYLYWLADHTKESEETLIKMTSQLDDRKYGEVIETSYDLDDLCDEGIEKNNPSDVDLSEIHDIYTKALILIREGNRALRDGLRNVDADSLDQAGRLYTESNKLLVKTHDRMEEYRDKQ